MSLPPWPIRAQVIAQNPVNDSLTVLLHSAQLTGFEVSMLYHGAADGLRLNKKPLPSRGTWGLVVFPNGDSRNGMWLGAYHPNLQTSVPADASDPFMDYESHQSGHYQLLDQFGNYLRSYADGSTETVNASGGAVPTTYRYIVDGNQQQQRVAFPYSQRVANPPAPFARSYVQATSGSNGGHTQTVDASGNYDLGFLASRFLNITQGGAAATDFLGLVSKLVSAFNSHVHTGVTTGNSNTGTPASPWTSTTIKSTIINISN